VWRESTSKLKLLAVVARIAQKNWPWPIYYCSLGAEWGRFLIGGNKNKVGGVSSYMNLDRLGSLVAAPTAGLLLLMCLCAIAPQRPRSVGMHVPLPKVRLDSVSNCDFVSDRDLVVRIRKDESIWINETMEKPEELGPTLTKIYEHRAEKFVYIISDPEVSFGKFARVYHSVGSSTDNLHVLLLTSGLDTELHQCPEGISCGLDWPGGSYQPCVWRNIPWYPPPRLHSPAKEY